MDNKKNNNPMTDALNQVLKGMNRFIKNAETGEGYVKTPEEKKLWQEKFKELGAKEKVDALKEKFPAFKEFIDKINSNGATNKV